MNTYRFIAEARTKAREAQAKARRRQSRIAEFEAFCAGGGLVLAGLLLAAVYCLLRQQLTA